MRDEFGRLVGRESEPSFAPSEFAVQKRPTRRERFLAGMPKAVPGARAVALIEPFHPKGERMRRVDFLESWSALGDEALADALSDRQARRAFVGQESVPAATTLLKVRHLLEPPGLTRALLREVNAPPGEQGLRLREGTIVAATMVPPRLRPGTRPGPVIPAGARRRSPT